MTDSATQERLQTRQLLWITIVALLFLRVLCVWLWSPLDSTASDSARHLEEAIAPPSTFHYPFVSLLEPPPYGFWLGLFLKHFQADRFSVFAYASAMSVIMPISWYLWMKAYFKNEMYALTGFAIFAGLPNFIGIFSFFQPDSVLLTLLGFSLFCHELFVANPRVLTAVTAGLTWGLTIATRLTVLPATAIGLLWESLVLGKTVKRGKVVMLLLAELACIGLVYLWIPITHWQRLKVIEFAPGMVRFSKVLYESGKTALLTKVLYLNGYENQFHLASPAAVKCDWDSFGPSLAWANSRSGVGETNANFNVTFPVYESRQLTVKDRMRLWKENINFFFYNSSWPENTRAGFIFALGTFMTHLWLPFFLATVSLILLYRVWTMPTVLFIAMSLVLVLQQTSIVEGRYRKPLECIAVVALLDIVRLRAFKGDLKKLSGQMVATTL